MGRQVAENVPQDSVKKASEGIAGFIEGSIDVAQQRSKKAGDEYIDRLKKEAAAQQAEFERQRRYRDKGFPANYKDYKTDGGFSSHGKNQGFDSHSE